MCQSYDFCMPGSPCPFLLHPDRLMQQGLDAAESLACPSVFSIRLWRGRSAAHIAPKCYVSNPERGPPVWPRHADSALSQN